MLSFLQRPKILLDPLQTSRPPRPNMIVILMHRDVVCVSLALGGLMHKLHWILAFTYNTSLCQSYRYTGCFKPGLCEIEF